MGCLFKLLKHTQRQYCSNDDCQFHWRHGPKKCYLGLSWRIIFHSMCVGGPAWTRGLNIVFCTLILGAQLLNWVGFAGHMRRRFLGDGGAAGDFVLHDPRRGRQISSRHHGREHQQPSDVHLHVNIRRDEVTAPPTALLPRIPERPLHCPPRRRSPLPAASPALFS